MNYKKFLKAASAALAIVMVFVTLVPDVRAQNKYKTLHKFTGNNDTAGLYAGLIFDSAGNLYGTTMFGGNPSCGAGLGCGVVFKLASNADGGWTESLLYQFTGQPDGSYPVGGLIFDQAGNLYGMANEGGAYGGGAVFRLTPNADGGWTESVLYSFCSLTNCGDGGEPYGGLILDAPGNLYGTTSQGGQGWGTVFELTPNTNGSWSENVLYTFTGGADGVDPDAGLIFDQVGNLYGTTTRGGVHGWGVVFELTPNTDGSWIESILYSFGPHGRLPVAGLVFDTAGNLYGTTVYGRTQKGTVFKLTKNADGSWTESVLHSFSGGKDGEGPGAGLIFDQVGNLYGTAEYGGDLSCPDGPGCGVVFKLAPNSNGRWIETVLHTFLGHPGGYPTAGVIFNSAGNLYGTTSGDGSETGSVFEITP